MKSRIFMYLFLFALLLVLFQYVNQKGIYESQNKKIVSLQSKVEKLKDSVATLESLQRDFNYFKLIGNDNAMTYFENQNMDAVAVQQKVSDEIYSKNSAKEDNPLVPYAGMHGLMAVNKVYFLNHKWLIADFTDGVYWGEMLLYYDIDKDDAISFEVLGAMLYPN